MVRKLVLFLAAGCTQATMDDASSAEASTLALFSVEQSSAEPSHQEVVGRFLRFHGMDADTAIERVGGGYPVPEVGTCAPLPSAAAPVRTGMVELADVGPVSAELLGRVVPLSKRHVPDVVEAVKGVLYSGAAEPSEPDALLRFRWGAEEAEVKIPAKLALALPDGMAWDRLPRGELPLRWASEGSSDRIVVDVHGTGIRRGRCTFADSGSAIVPESAFGGATQGDLQVHRIRTLPAPSGSFDVVAVQFDYASPYAFRRP